jgi:hypothetical protein
MRGRSRRRFAQSREMCALQTNLGVVSAVTPSEGPLQVTTREPAQQRGGSARVGKAPGLAGGRGCRWCVCARPGFPSGPFARSLARSFGCVCLCVCVFVCLCRKGGTDVEIEGSGFTKNSNFHVLLGDTVP